MSDDRMVKVLLGSAAAAFAGVQVWAWPSAIAVQDESIYLATAYILRRGTVFADVAHVSVLSGVAHAGHVVPLYPPGQGALLLPFTLAGWRVAFAANLLAQLAGFLLFAMLLERLGISRAWAVLYLFYPSLVLYSRTLMSDVPSTAITVAALLAYVRGPRGKVAAGALLGASLFLRYANLFTFAFLALAAGLRDLAGWRRPDGPMRLRELRLAQLGVGFVPLGALFAAYNLAVSGRPATPGYTSAARFGLAYVPGHLLFYVIALGLVYPAMLLAPLAYRGPLRAEILLLGYGILAAQSAYFYLDSSGSLPERILVGSRLLLPVVPVFLIAYAQVLDRVAERIRGGVTAAACAAAAVGVIAVVAVSAGDQDRLDNAARARAAIARALPQGAALLANGEATKFLSPAWDRRQYLVFGSQAAPGRWSFAPGAGQPVAIVYAANARDTADLSAARRLAARYHAAVVLNHWSWWHVMVWTTPSARSAGRGEPP